MISQKLRPDGSSQCRRDRADVGVADIVTDLWPGTDEPFLAVSVKEGSLRRLARILGATDALDLRTLLYRCGFSDCSDDFTWVPRSPVLAATITARSISIAVDGVAWLAATDLLAANSFWDDEPEDCVLALLLDAGDEYCGASRDRLLELLDNGCVFVTEISIVDAGGRQPRRLDV